ncbi:MAG: hypothetical protein K2L51_05520, partial [Clostridiales bacterium]|nr:hypothetical protein [Clostridiales bacterium]
MKGLKSLTAFVIALCIMLFCAACAPQSGMPSVQPPDGAVVTPENPETPDPPSNPDGNGAETPDTPNNPSKPTEPADGGVLVAYFSYTGNTRTVAEYIARYSGGTAAEITAKQPYTAADVNYNDYNSRCQTERRADARPEIADSAFEGIDMSEYATVIIGYPIWNGEEPMIIRTFIERYGELTDKTVYTFSTSSSSSPAALNAAMKTRYGETDFAGNLHFTRSTLA